MKVAIVGIGFVGKALSNVLKDTVNLKKIDPSLGTSIKDLALFNPELVFICVPTPMKKNGNQDLSILNEVVDEINNYKIETLLVLKSTVLPQSVKEIEKKYPNLIYNPEFLRENHAEEDLINSKFILHGGDKEIAKKLSTFYEKHTKCVTKNYVYLDLISASLVKYTINSFLATKVIFFNQLFEIFSKSNTKEEWKNVINVLSMDSRIGETHMDVPGHDGRKGFGGACFPKDTSAFLKYSEQLDENFTLLKEAIKVNNSIRSKYNSKTKRELEQKIIFKFDD